MSAGTTPDESPPPAGEDAAELERAVPRSGAGAPPAPAGPLAEPSREVRVSPTKTSTVWTMLAVGVLLLLLILVFILQNGGRVLVQFWFWDATLPLGVALLFAVVLGALLVLAIGAARILQLRLAARQLKKDRPSAPWRRRGRSGS